MDNWVGTWQTGEETGAEEVHGHRPSPTTQRAEARGRSRRYIGKVHCGWGWEGAGEEAVLSHPAAGKHLRCRRDTGLSHCPPIRVQQPAASSQMDVGKRVRQGLPASFCKRHGGSVVRLRAVGEAKDVIVQLPPPCLPPIGPEHVSLVARCGWEPALLRTTYTSWTGHPDHDFPGPVDIRTLRTLQPPHRPPLGRGASLKGLAGLWN